VLRLRGEESGVLRCATLVQPGPQKTVPYGPEPESSTHSEMRSAAGDLRHLEGYLAMVRRSADEAELDPADEALARLAGEQAAAVGMLAELIEPEL
jgi:hypothetical protein